MSWQRFVHWLDTPTVPLWLVLTLWLVLIVGALLGVGRRPRARGSHHT